MANDKPANKESESSRRDGNGSSSRPADLPAGQFRAERQVPRPDPLSAPGTRRVFIGDADPGPHSDPRALPRPEGGDHTAMVEPSQDKEALAKGKEHLEARKRGHAESGTLSGEASGDINRHGPVGPIVGEVYKSREALQSRHGLEHQRGTREQDHQPKR